VADYYEVLELPHPGCEGEWGRLRMPDKKVVPEWLVAQHKWQARGIAGDITASNRFLVLVGPPGTGKTTVVQAGASIAAKILKQNGLAGKKVWMIRVSVPSIYNKYLGETSKRLHDVFQIARKITAGGDFVILVFDDCESLAIRREIALGSDSNPIDVAQAPVALIEELDRNRADHGLCVIATTNLFQGVVDPAITSRADMVIHVPLPDVEQRREIFQALFGELDERLGTRLAQSTPDDIDGVAILSEDLSGREIRKLALEALLGRQDLILRPEDLVIDDFLDVLRKRQNGRARQNSAPKNGMKH